MFVSCLEGTLHTSLITQILVETARFVRSNGGQVEVLLRVKQAANPAFKFLEPGHVLHPYYRWVLDTDPQVKPPLK
jgi:hypothetical protein